MLIPILIIIIVILAVHVPKNNAKTIIMKEFKPLFEKRLEDPLLPPERTYPSNRINIRTKGPEDPYQQVGFLYEQSSGIRLPLFGRRDYIGSDTWEYYVKDNTDNNNVKIPLDFKKELYNEDVVNVTSYNNEFQVEVYDVDQPKYLPNVL